MAEELQNRLRAWHDRTFPGAPNAAIGLKLAEEAGEACKAVNLLEHSAAGDLANLADEIGDVAVCLMVLADRYGLSFLGIVRERAYEVMNRRAGAV